MKLSTRGRYGVRALVYIALNAENDPVPIRTIAEHQGISERYLEQLLMSLKQGGLVKSIRGARGGYIIGRDAENITIGDIVRILEGPIAPVECVNEVSPDECARADYCVTRKVWSEVRDAISSILDSYSLYDLAAEQKKDRNSFNK